jgi:signal transduction histidine kinase
VNKKIYRIIASPIHDNDGKVIAAIELVENITERIAMERDLRQAQKLESIGQLAAGIAHEINTPTQYIGDNARFIQEAADDLLAVLTAYAGLLDAAKTGAPLGDHIIAVERQMEAADLAYLQEEIPQAIEQTLEGVSRVSKIVTSMRQFSHPGTGKKTPVDLNKALDATITVARNEWKYVADVQRNFDNRLPLVNCLPGEINQVLLNLLINAAHAIGEVSDNGKKGKGKIGITTEKDNGWARISISDTGGGIPEAIHQRIFDPFFTTKAVGKGTGQGLAIAHRVITENHNGTIAFDTQAGLGTTFTVKLPLAVAGDPDKEKGHAG